MARKRFYHQQRAAQYAQEKTAIDAYFAKTAAEKKTAYANTVAATGNKKSNVGKTPGYIIPFGFDQSKKVLLKVGLVAPGKSLVSTEENETAMITALQAVIIGDTKYARITAPPAGSFITDTHRKKIQVARIKIVKSADAPLANKIVSRITGTPYTYTKKDSISCPFGQKIGGTTTDDTTFEGVSANLEFALADYAVYTTPQGLIPISLS